MPKIQTYNVYNIVAAGGTKTYNSNEVIDSYEINATGGAVTLVADMIFSYSGTPIIASEFKFQYGGGVTQDIGSGITVSFFGTNLTDAEALQQLLITAYWNGSTWEIVKSVSPNSAFVQNGNSFGADAKLGTNDAYALELETNGTSRVHIDETNGNVHVGATSDAGNKLLVYTTTSSDGIYVNGTTKPAIGGYAAGVLKWVIGIATTIADWISTTAVGDVSLILNSKSFRVNVLNGGATQSSIIVNGDNGRVGISTDTTRANLHVTSIAVPTFTVPTVVNTSTLAMIDREHQPYLAYSVNVGQVLTLTPLTPDSTASTGNVGRIFWITNTGLGHIDFGGSALVKDITGATFGSGASGIPPGTGMMFVVMSNYMQQVI